MQLIHSICRQLKPTLHPMMLTPLTTDNCSCSIPHYLTLPTHMTPTLSDWQLLTLRDTVGLLQQFRQLTLV